MKIMTGEKYFILEPENLKDDQAIEQLLDAAFGQDRHSLTSYRLRDGRTRLRDLGLILRTGAVLSGTIRFWPVSIGSDVPALLLGPLAVHPDHHGHGGGQLLMKAGLDLARSHGHSLIFLVGDLPYYRKAGFKLVPKGQVLLPGPFDPERLLYQELVPGAFQDVQGMMQVPGL